MQDGPSCDLSSTLIATVPAYPVAPGRCPHCGREPALWTPTAIIAAAQAHYVKYGVTPTAKAWARTARDHPAHITVLRIFGSWANLDEAAGLPAAPQGRPTFWTRERIAVAMLDHIEATGHWPTWRDWAHAAPEHPHFSHIYIAFRDKPAAVAYALRFEARQQRSLVPVAPIVEAVRSYIQDGGSLESVAELAGYDAAEFRRKLARVSVTSATADRILTAISRPDVAAELLAA